MTLCVLLLLSSCAIHFDVYRVEDVDTLYFGSAKPDHTFVTDAEWTRFVHDVVAPKVDGFTTWDAVGGWKQQRETSHVLQIIHNGSANAAIAEIIAAYRKQFAQESVLRVHARAGVAFQ